MQSKRQNLFTTVRSEGAILPADLLVRVLSEDRDLVGLTSEGYHLSGERLNEAINRSWNRLQGAWAAFSGAENRLIAEDPATSITRERWLFPLFQELGYGRLVPSKSIEIEGRAYQVSHIWQQTPIHLVGCRVDLDRRTAGIAGAARTSPHSHVQELLGRAPEYLWGFVSNGYRLRILRDNKSLTRQAFVEFDLLSMLEGQVYPDFKLLWLLCHQSSVEVDDPTHPEHCRLEKWSQTSLKQGTRALDQLRAGVENAIAALGRGFLAHPANGTLRDRLRTGNLNEREFYRQILRLVYRLLFLFVAEDRDLLFEPSADVSARERYSRYYSTQRLRAAASKLRGTTHADLYRGLALVFNKLHETGCPNLGLSALGSFLWSPKAVHDLNGNDIFNRDLLEAVRELAFTTDGEARRPVDYRNLGSEELGSIYESLLELHPRLTLETAVFTLATAPGSERKTTGSYYTPTSLVNCLLDSALEPVIDAAAKSNEPEKAILNLKVCDPACGSGHFLIAAAHRIAKRLASVRTGDEEPPPADYRHALRDVIRRCIYGVDLNPMAVELCKVSLWMESLDPGRPLSFLDAHIRLGNSLLGTTPALLKRGIPDDAFKPIEGDDSSICSELKRRNRLERGGQGMLTFRQPEWLKLGNLVQSFINLSEEDDSTPLSLVAKEQHYEHLVRSLPYENAQLIADAWCTAFICDKRRQSPLEITEAIFRRWEDNPHSISPGEKEELQRHKSRFQFFHWHLAFPEVFRPKSSEQIGDGEITGWSGGFDCVLGNPPWERVKLQEKEWFAERRPDIADALNASARRKMVEALATEDPELHREFLSDRRKAEGESVIARETGRYPLCGRGDVNTYALFAEGMRQIHRVNGRVGVIVPSGIATDDATRFFFSNLIDNNSLVRLLDFENSEAIFPGVHRSYKFSLLTIGRAAEPAQFAFFLHNTDELLASDRTFTLTADAIALLNPNTRTCPIFRSRKDAEITQNIYRRIPILVNAATSEANSWEFDYMTKMFDMADSSHEFVELATLVSKASPTEVGTFKSENGVEFSPLYEAKHVHLFDHRWGLEVDTGATSIPADTNSRKPAEFLTPRYWVPRSRVEERLDTKGWRYSWLLVWRDICRTTDVRTVVGGVIPRTAVGHTLRIAFTRDIGHAITFISTMSSFVFDYVARQKVGGIHLTVDTLKQLPFVAHSCSVSGWLTFARPRVLELAYTSWDLESFAKDCGYEGPPFVWDEERRFQVRSELDAALFHLYGINRDEVDYIMETFPIVKRKDVEKYGNFRTKVRILEIFDEMIGGRVINSERVWQAILLLVGAWKQKGKAIGRPAFEISLILMFDDNVRTRLLGASNVVRSGMSAKPASHPLTGLDYFIAEGVRRQWLKVGPSEYQQVIEAGDQFPENLDAAVDDLTRLAETMTVVDRLRKQEIELPTEVQSVTLATATVSTASSASAH